MLESFFGRQIVYGIKIGFIGLGKLGLPSAEAIASKGFDVCGYDINYKTSDLVEIRDSIEDVCRDRDIVFIATPTPHQDGYDGTEPTSEKEVKDFNYDGLRNVISKCNKHMGTTQSLVLISTVIPGTIRRELAPLCTNVKLLYNPYLIAMGTVKHDVLNPEMVMIGTAKGNYQTAVKGQQLEAFYNQMCDDFVRIEFGTWEEIEATKIFYNTFISNKIAMVNMIQDVAQKLGHMDVDKVTGALSKCTQRIVSPSYMKAGMGDGGACHPRDNIALSWLSQELGLGYDMFGSMMKAREKQAENMALEILKHGKNICFTSDTYKPGTTLTDGSYSLLVQHYIKKHGGTIANGFDNPVQVVVRVHETDQISADDSTIVFDPWRTYPKADNVVYYGRQSS